MSLLMAANYTQKKGEGQHAFADSSCYTLNDHETHSLFRASGLGACRRGICRRTPCRAATRPGCRRRSIGSLRTAAARGRVAAHDADHRGRAQLVSALRARRSIPAGVTDLGLASGQRPAVRRRRSISRAWGRAASRAACSIRSSYLTGSLPLAVNGVLRTKNGVGTFALESASISGVPVPAWMLQEIVSYYSKSRIGAAAASRSTSRSRCPPASARSSSRAGRHRRSVSSAVLGSTCNLYEPSRVD